MSLNQVPPAEGRILLFLFSVVAHPQQATMAEKSRPARKALRVIAGGDYLVEKKALSRREDISIFFGRGGGELNVAKR